jgi:hypothetical protein
MQIDDDAGAKELRKAILALVGRHREIANFTTPVARGELGWGALSSLQRGFAQQSNSTATFFQPCKA